MSDRILVPVLGESVTEATVAKWLKTVGEKVNIDEAIVELETDKVNIEVPAPSAGIIEKISVEEGQTVNVGALLGTIIESKNSTQSTPRVEKEYSPPPKKLEAIKEEEIKLFEKKRRGTFNSNRNSRRRKNNKRFRYKDYISSGKKNC